MPACARGGPLASRLQSHGGRVGAGSETPLEHAREPAGVKIEASQLEIDLPTAVDRCEVIENVAAFMVSIATVQRGRWRADHGDRRFRRRQGAKLKNMLMAAKNEVR